MRSFDASPTQRRAPGRRLKERFRVLEFMNRSGTQSWRVDGVKRDGSRVRLNYQDQNAAVLKRNELEAEFHSNEAFQTPSIQATHLSEAALRLTEKALARLDRPEDILLAVDHWLRVGRHQKTTESPRLDQAVREFLAWVAETPTLRPPSKQTLTTRVPIFANSVPNVRVGDVTPELVEGFLEKRPVSAVSRDNERRSLSRFFAWCIERPRRWITHNPAREVKVERAEDSPPEILTVEECEQLLRAAENYQGGRLVPYVSLCLFAGLRPSEAQRLTWDKLNLDDSEIRLEGTQTKTGRSRVVVVHPTLKAWLLAYRHQQLSPSGLRRRFETLKRLAGFGAPSEKHPDLRPWVPDVLRHTAISHAFRESGSYGRTAEQFGNSEAIIKRHYQGRVSSADTRTFYSIKPKRTK